MILLYIDIAAAAVVVVYHRTDQPGSDGGVEIENVKRVETEFQRVVVVVVVTISIINNREKERERRKRGNE